MREKLRQLAEKIRNPFVADVAFLRREKIFTSSAAGSTMKGYQNELTLEERWQVVAYMRRELAGARE